MASVTLVGEGGSRALLRNEGTSPSPRSLMVRAISWSGVLNISGVMCCGILGNGDGQHNFRCFLQDNSFVFSNNFQYESNASVCKY